MILDYLVFQDAHSGFLDCHPGKHNPFGSCDSCRMLKDFIHLFLVITGKNCLGRPYTLNFFIKFLNGATHIDSLRNNREFANWNYSCLC